MKSLLSFLVLSICFSPAHAQSGTTKEETVASITKELIANASHTLFSIDSLDHSLYYNGCIDRAEFKEFVTDRRIPRHKVNFDNVTGYQFQDDRKHRTLPKQVRRLCLYIYLQNDTMPIILTDTVNLATQKKLSAALDRLVELNIRENFNYP